MKKAIMAVIVLACFVCASCAALQKPPEPSHLALYREQGSNMSLPKEARDGAGGCYWGDQRGCYFASKYFNRNGSNPDECAVAQEFSCNACKGVDLGEREPYATYRHADFPEKLGTCGSCIKYQKIAKLIPKCTAGDATSCTDLYYILDEEIITDPRSKMFTYSCPVCPFYRDKKEDYMQLGCDGGDPRACKWVAEKEEAEARVRKMAMSSTSSDPIMDAFFAMQAMESAQSVRDPIKKRAAYQKGCESTAIEGDSHLSAWFESGACYNWGLMLLNGEGGEVDIELAKKAFAMSCQKGIADGCKALSEINNL